MKTPVLSPSTINKETAILKSEVSLAEARQDLLNKISTVDTDYERLLSAISERKRESLKKRLATISYSAGLTAPITCLGPNKCPFFQLCPLGNGVDKERRPIYEKEDLFPVGQACILERAFVEQRLISYLEEFNVDPNHISEMALVNDLITIDLQKTRALSILSLGDKNEFGRDFMATSFSYSDKPETAGAVTGEEYKEHPLMARIDALDKKRIAILDQLNATRKAKATIVGRFIEQATNSKYLEDLAEIKKAVISTIKNKGSVVIDADEIQLD